MSYKKYLITAICTSSFCGSFMGSSINIAVPALAAEYMVSPDRITAVIEAYVLTVTAFLLPATAIANKFGYKTTFMAGVLCSAVIALLLTLMPNFYTLLAANALQGIANSAVFCTAYALLSDNLTKEERGPAFGITTAAVYAGLSLSPSLGGFLTDTVGWRAMFYLAALGHSFAFILTRSTPKDKPNTTYYPYLKMVMVFIGFVLVLLSASVITREPMAGFAIVAGMLILLCYLALEKRSHHPLLPVSMLSSNGILSFALLGSLCNYTATFAIALLLSLYFQVILGYSASQTGLLLMIQPTIQCLISPLVGRIVNRINPHLICGTGMMMCTMATAIFALSTKDTNYYFVLSGQIIAGLGFGLFSTPNTIIVMSSVDRKFFALASGLQALSRNCGMSLCMVSLSIILLMSITAQHGTRLYLEQLSVSISTSFLISTVLGTCGIIFCYLSYTSQRKL